MGPTNDLEELTARVAAMAARIAELESERGRRDGLAVQAHDGRVSRRGVLRFAVAGVGASAAVASAAMFGAPTANAATGDSLVLGNANTADATTSITGSGTVDALSIVNAAAAGSAVSVAVTDTVSTGDVVTIAQSGTGMALRAASSAAASGPVINASISNVANSAVVVSASTVGNGSAVSATANGAGHAVLGRAQGAGYGVYGYSNAVSGAAMRAYIENSANPRSALRASTLGSGAGVEGGSLNGRGGRFSGKLAQIQLVPGAATHPASGSPGDFYVDALRRLWFCRGGAGWVQIA
jgi:hypothetical protein